MGNAAEILRPSADPRKIQAVLTRLWSTSNFAGQASGEESAIHPVHEHRIRAAMEAGLPIRFALPAFPAKSPNPRKTMGARPDYAELLALQNLNSLAKDISRFYEPGAEIVICSDGRVFSDLVGVSDALITAYARKIEEMAARHELQYIRTFHLEQVMTGSGDELRKELLEKYAQSTEEIREKVLSQDNCRRTYNGLHRFLFEDAVEGSGKSRQKVRNETKVQAYELMRRSEAWSQLVEEYFPDAVRLSIHPQPLNSTKFPVQLVASENQWRTPWHSVALFKENVWTLVAREEAEALGAKPRLSEEGLGYYS